MPITNEINTNNTKVIIWWIPSTFKASKLPIKIPINMYAADALDTVANAEVIAHNSHSAIANDLSSTISQA